MKWPQITELNNVTITAVYPSDDADDLKFGASERSPVLEHYRFGKPRSVVKVLPITEGDLARAKIVKKPCVYGGLLFNHFGHTIGESIHRLWPRIASKPLSSAAVVFAPVTPKVRPSFVEALSLHGISEDRVLRLTKPLCFRRLFIGAQARQLGGLTLIEGYRSMLDKSLAERLPSPNRRRRLYISRLEYHWSGSFYGESAVARHLASQGFEIVYPERHSLTELVTMLRDAKIAIFAEGSAIHALELCGSTVPDVLMISRRPGSEWRFAALLENVCTRWCISDHLLFSAGLTDFTKRQSGVLDLPAVMRDIQLFTGGTKGADWGWAWAADAIEEDCERLIKDARGAEADDHFQRSEELRSAIRSGIATRS